MSRVEHGMGGNIQMEVSSSRGCGQAGGERPGLQLQVETGG